MSPDVLGVVGDPLDDDDVAARDEKIEYRLIHNEDKFLTFAVVGLRYRKWNDGEFVK